MKKINWVYTLIAIGFVLMLASGCEKDENNNLPSALEIGQSYQGGIIAYILMPGDPGYSENIQHGLIAAPSDQSTETQWCIGSPITTYATAKVLGSGNSNTNLIVNVQGEGVYAAKFCYDLELNGYSDWYLPSLDELYKLYLNKEAIGGFTDDKYWSSSEYSQYQAWDVYVTNGEQGLLYKDATYHLHVRAIRKF